MTPQPQSKETDMSDGNGSKPPKISNVYELAYTLIYHFGFPAAVTSALLFGAYQFGDRMTTGYVNTLVVVQDSVKRQSTAMEKFAESMTINEQNAKERTQLLHTILTEQQKTTVAIETLKRDNGM